MNERPDSDPAGDEGAPAAGDPRLTDSLQRTLRSLQQSIARMEEIVAAIESGDPDWEENIELLAEANELAEESSRVLDRVVQDVVYGEGAAGSGEDGPAPQPDADPGDDGR